MLKIDLEPGQSVRIGDFAVVTLEEKSGQRARLAFKADRSIPISKIAQAASSDAQIAARLGISNEAPALA